MCGIVGYSGKGGALQRKSFIELCRQACIRGVHAFGIGYFIPETGLHVYKSTDFNEVMKAVPGILPGKIMFHCRYSTSGDYKDMANNQPVYVHENALVFNGTIDMGTKEEMEQHCGFSLQTSNDGELVLRDLEKQQPFNRISDGKATFAGIALMKDGSMCAFRNDLRPLWAFNCKDEVFISSTLDIALRAKINTDGRKLLQPLVLHQL